MLGDAGAPQVVHVRDTLMEPADRRVRELQRTPLQLEADSGVQDALTRMRLTSTQFATVMRDGRFLGVVTMADILRRLLAEPDAAAEVA